MKISPNTLRIGIAVTIVVGTIAWLALSGIGASKSYYVTIPELGAMGDKAYHSQLRVEGFVQPGSIEQSGTHVTFVLNEFESHSPKAATGRTYGRDGVFHATVLQAKCASKYAPAQPGAQPAASPHTAAAHPAAAAPATAN
jgi:cytochrome c-type biogenesis protein CcmE